MDTKGIRVARLILNITSLNDEAALSDKWTSQSNDDFFQELSTIFPSDQKVPVSFAYVLNFPPICRPMLKQTDLTWNNPSKDDVRYVIEKNKLKWSERRDSNPRPLHPQYSALPGCATLRPVLVIAAPRYLGNRLFSKNDTA